MKYFKKSGFSKFLLTTMATLCLSQVSTSAYTMNWRYADIEANPNSSKITLQCRIMSHEYSRPTIYVYAKGKLIGSQQCASNFWGLNAVTTIKIQKQAPGTPISLKAVWVDKGESGKGPVSKTYGHTFTSWYNTAIFKNFKTFTVNTPIKSSTTTIQGKGEPGAVIVVSNKTTLSTFKSTTVDSKGNYTIKYPKQKAGHVLSISQLKDGYVTVSKEIKVSK